MAASRIEDFNNADRFEKTWNAGKYLHRNIFRERFFSAEHSLDYLIQQSAKSV
jgi:hypothetical protein